MSKSLAAAYQAGRVAGLIEARTILTLDFMTGEPAEHTYQEIEKRLTEIEAITERVTGEAGK